MSKILSLTTAAIFACVFVFTSTAAALEPNKAEVTYFGKIVSIDAAASKFVMAAEIDKKIEPVTIAVTAQTRIGKGGAPITLTGLSVKDNIRIKLNNDNKTANTILVITGGKTQALINTTNPQLK